MLNCRAYLAQRLPDDKGAANARRDSDRCRMTKQVLRGVPRALLIDGWWLTTADHGTPPPPPHGPLAVGLAAGPVPKRAGALGLLVLLADFLFYDQWIGLSLILFGLLLATAILVTANQENGPRGVVGLIILAMLPVAEAVQPLSLLFWMAGLLVAVVWAVLGHTADWTARCSVAARFLIRLPGVAALDLTRGISRSKASGRIAGQAVAVLRGWAMPLGVGAVFAALIVVANPVLEGWLNALTALRAPPATLLARVMFWGLMAALIWPFLCLVPQRAGPAKPPRRRPVSQPAQAVRFGVNPASVANALALFNLIFALQTAMDLTYLWGGADLPDGLTHAEYAHRGAYPLVVTALLAGAFALISRPFTQGRPLLRGLLALWLGQNILLVISSLYRLDLYVESYGLTYLRIGAAIWMALVATGLLLTAWQLWRGKTNLWLLGRNAALLVAVLYACCFVNFAALIAQSNLARFSGDDLDSAYLCSLGANAAAVIAAHDLQTGTPLCASGGGQGPQIHGWRDWGFRSWRVRRNLAAVLAQVQESNGENSGR